MDKIFKSLSDQNRRKIVTLLKNNEMSVNEILKYFDISQATLSSHLANLRKSKLVENKVNGKQRIYRLNKEVLGEFVNSLNKFIGNIQANISEEISIRGR